MSNTLDDAIRAREESRYADAHAILAALLAQNPADARANYHMAWLHDAQGLERAAVPYYEAALAGDLPDTGLPDTGLSDASLSDADLRGALLGFGSTLRSLGEYGRAAEILRRGMARFPEAGEFPAFLAMALYNLGEHRAAVALLLQELTRSSNDPGIQRYRRAIDFYRAHLDEVWYA